MIKRLFYILLILIVLSCNKEDSDIKQANGEIWLSGGYAYCAQQIWLDNGDTLIVSLVDLGDISSFLGEKINVKYKVIGVNEYCPPHIDCEIIKIKKID